MIAHEHRAWPAVASLCALLLVGGCYHYRLTPLAPNGTRLPVATEPTETTAWAFFWGLAQPELRPHECQGNGLAEVSVGQNLGFTLLTVVTLGIAVPLQMQWRCAKDVATAGDDF